MLKNNKQALQKSVFASAKGCKFAQKLKEQTF
jgi:hypothetical protein